MAPLIKIWVFRLKDPSASLSQDSPFGTLWKSVFRHCYDSSGHTSARHALYRCTTRPEVLCMISGYPSQESTDAADSSYEQKYGNEMAGYVEHVGICQIAADAKGNTMTTILDRAEFLRLDVVRDEEEMRAALADEVIKGAITMRVEGPDEWPGLMRRKKGEDGDGGDVVRDWVCLSGWATDTGAKHGETDAVVLRSMYFQKAFRWN